MHKALLRMLFFYKHFNSFTHQCAQPMRPTATRLPASQETTSVTATVIAMTALMRCAVS